MEKSILALVLLVILQSCSGVKFTQEEKDEIRERRIEKFHLREPRNFKF